MRFNSSVEQNNVHVPKVEGKEDIKDDEKDAKMK